MIDRAPAFGTGPDASDQKAFIRDSQITCNVISAHVGLVSEQLAIGESDQFVIDEYALQGRKEQLEKSSRTVYTVGRGIHQLATNINSTTSKVSDEFGRSKTLDIGCGEGRLGLDLERKAKTPFVYLDRDPECLDKIRTRRGAKVQAEALSLPFSDGEFEKTISMYAANLWSIDPVDCLAEILEQLRVTREGGTAMFVPLITQILKRQQYLGQRDVDRRYNINTTEEQEREDTAIRVWDMRDFLVVKALSNLVKEGFLDITYTSFIGDGVVSGSQMEAYSAIIDVKNQLNLR